MNFNLKKAYAALLRFGPSADEEDEHLPESMVLLLREPRFPNLDDLRVAGERAFGRPFDNSKQSRHFVIQVVLFTFMKVGSHTLSFLSYTKPYGQDRDLGLSLNSSQRQAWAEHNAWIAVDYKGKVADSELKYAVLAKLCRELLTDNCVGVYLPKEGHFTANTGTLQQGLQILAASRKIDVE